MIFSILAHAPNDKKGDNLYLKIIKLESQPLNFK